MKVEVCLTPALIEQHDLNGKIAVVVDIFRATSCMVTGLSCDVSAIYPVATVDECLALGAKGMIMAGERGGQKIEAFDIGNSPFDYQSALVKDRDVAVSTTNGTLAISKSGDADEVLIGAFLNMAATVKYIKEKDQDITVHCAGWKGTPNLEDTLYAGALIHELGEVEMINDSAFIALSLYHQHKDDLEGAGKASAHAKRLAGFGITEDISFCMQQDVYDTVIYQEGEKLIKKS